MSPNSNSCETLFAVSVLANFHFLFCAFLNWMSTSTVRVRAKEENRNGDRWAGRQDEHFWSAVEKWFSSNDNIKCWDQIWLFVFTTVSGIHAPKQNPDDVMHTSELDLFSSSLLSMFIYAHVLLEHRYLSWCTNKVELGYRWRHLGKNKDMMNRECIRIG